MGPLPEVRGGKHAEIVTSKLAGVQARDMMRTGAPTVKEDTPLSVVLPLMDRAGTDEVLVMDGQVVLGVVSTSHLLRRHDLALTTKAKRVMVSPPGVGPSANAMELAETFISTRFRELVITDRRGRLAGLVTRRDLTRLVADVREFRGVPVSLLMTPDPRTVRAEDSVEAARQLLQDLDIRTAPVVADGGELVGGIGLRDITRYLWREKQKETVGEVTGMSAPVEVTVESVMFSAPLTVPPGTSIAQAARTMLDREVSTLFVCEDDTLLGVLTEYDLLSHLASFLEREMVLVKISGFDGNQDAFDALFEEAHGAMVKVARIERPTLVDIHVSAQREKGDREAFTVQGRMTTEHRMYYAHATAWDVMQGLAQMLDHLERQVKERKDEYLDWRRHVGS